PPPDPAKSVGGFPIAPAAPKPNLSPVAPAQPATTVAAAPAAAAEVSPLKLKPKMPASSPEQNANGVSIANWPTADIALPSDTTTNAANASTPPFSVAPFPVGADAIPAKSIHIPAPALPKTEKAELE